MMKFTWMLAALAGAALPLAAVETAPIFSDNMVLQRDTPVRVWGFGRPGEAVKVVFGEASASAAADAKGDWKVELPPQASSDKPATLTVTGENTLTFGNVLVGDVWLCAGQSNMQFNLKSAIGGAELVAAANDPALRLYQVPRGWSRVPEKKLAAKWQPCTPETAANFTAVGYLFGRDIKKATGVPVGLVNISWGGCRIEAMSARESFAQFPTLKETAKSVESQIADMNAKKDEELRKDKQRLPTVLFNAMVNPLMPFAVKGLLWYQGEDNHYEGAIYTEKLKALAWSWRTGFENPKMPIYLVQLPPFRYNKEHPFRLPEFKAAQQRFAVSDPDSGFVTATDCGLTEDIHPKDKVPLANRLAKLVLFKTYGIGNDDVFAPEFLRATPKDGALEVEFLHSNGLKTRDGQPVSDLMLAGDDGKFQPATGTIENDRLIVRSDKVAKPVRVRFGWDQIANPNLVNRAGVPAATFDSAVPVR